MRDVVKAKSYNMTPWKSKILNFEDQLLEIISRFEKRSYGYIFFKTNHVINFFFYFFRYSRRIIAFFNILILSE